MEVVEKGSFWTVEGWRDLNDTDKAQVHAKIQVKIAFKIKTFDWTLLFLQFQKYLWKKSTAGN